MVTVRASVREFFFTFFVKEGKDHLRCLLFWHRLLPKQIKLLCSLANCSWLAVGVVGVGLTPHAMSMLFISWVIHKLARQVRNDRAGVKIQQVGDPISLVGSCVYQTFWCAYIIICFLYLRSPKFVLKDTSVMFYLPRPFVSSTIRLQCFRFAATYICMGMHLSRKSRSFFPILFCFN